MKTNHPLIGKQVTVDWSAPESDDDWRHFKVMDLGCGLVNLKGVTDADGNTHAGDCFWVPLSEIKIIVEGIHKTT